LLSVIQELQPKTQTGVPLSQNGVLGEAARRLGIRNNRDAEQALLTQWGELFRTGLLAWGLNLPNPNPPHFHLTGRGRQALANLTRDPSNPAGYLRHLASIARLSPVANSYLVEGLECYVAGLHKAAAVMIGGAAESVILELRDITVEKLTAAGRKPPSELDAWKIKTVTDGLKTFFDGLRQQLNRELRESLDAYWSAFPQQIRVVRNDAGHPTGVDPVTPDVVHASFLIFPELAKLANSLTAWVISNVK